MRYLILSIMIGTLYADITFTKEQMRIIKKAHFKPKILKVYNTPFKAYKTDASWLRYKKHILTPQNFQKAKDFMQKHSKLLDEVEQVFGVEKEIITAFVAIESRYCTVTGKTNILDALVTLSFHKNRKQEFFKSELKSFLRLCKKRGLDPTKQFGSFAGAMGCVQQLPSIQLDYGVDFDVDGRVDPFSMSDSLATIANFLSQNGWQKSKTIAVKAKFQGDVKLPTGYNKVYDIGTLSKEGIVAVKKFDEDRASLLKLYLKDGYELWLGAKNMRIITKYNNSTNYGMAIFRFSEALKQK